MTTVGERVRALLAKEGTQTLEWLDKELRKCVNNDDLEGVKNLLKLGASPAMNDGMGSTFYQSMDKSGAKSDAIFNLMLEHPHTAQVVNGTSSSWPPFQTAMVAFRPDRARKIMNHPAYRFNHTGAPWQFQSFVFKELGARKHGDSQNRYEDEAIYADIKRVALEWFEKNGLTPPQLYYTKSVFTKSCKGTTCYGDYEILPELDFGGKFDVTNMKAKTLDADTLAKVMSECKKRNCNVFVVAHGVAWMKRVVIAHGRPVHKPNRNKKCTMYVHKRVSSAIKANKDGKRVAELKWHPDDQNPLRGIKDPIW